MLGQKSVFAKECFDGGYVGVDFGIGEDLTGKLPEGWREFNKNYIPVYLKAHPDKTKIAAGLACGFLWTVAKGFNVGDIVLCPDGSGSYHIGEVTSEYRYVPRTDLPHRRLVIWNKQTIDRSAMSEDLQNSTRSIGTVCNITGYKDEIEKLLGGAVTPVIVSTDPEVEDPSAFAMEKHLEYFLVQNWAQTELGKEYNVYTEEGEVVGQQYLTDTGPLDILAISKDKKRLLVIELKKGRASDVVLGQILRYMGYVKEELAEDDQSVSGIIIALEDDQRIRRALSVTPNVAFYRYEISFRLVKGIP